MIAMKIEGATKVISGEIGGTKPYGVTDLYVAEVEGFYVSHWQPLPSEMAILMAGGSVELWVERRRYHPHPAIAIGAAPLAEPAPEMDVLAALKKNDLTIPKVPE